MSNELNLPIFTPRPYQLPLLSAIDSKKYNRIFIVWSRRLGKDVCLWNMMIKKAFMNKGTYFYLLPNYTQAKKILWDGMTNDGFKFSDYVPKQLVRSLNATELKITLINGSILQLVGSENIDILRGTNPIGVVFSEFAYHNPQAWDVLRPILAVNNGFAWFDTTPNGKNFAYDLWESTKDDDGWWNQTLNAKDVGIPNKEQIEAERKQGMTDEMINQEFYASWHIGMLGAYYGKPLEEARKQQV